MHTILSPFSYGITVAVAVLLFGTTPHSTSQMACMFYGMSTASKIIGGISEFLHSFQFIHNDTL